MLLIVTWTICLVLWIVLWSIGAKSLDVWILLVLIMSIAAAVHIALPSLPGNRRGGSRPGRTGS
jgi:hypothetical protein